MTLYLRISFLLCLLLTLNLCGSKKGTTGEITTDASTIPNDDRISCALSYLSYLGEEVDGTEFQMASQILNLIENNIDSVPVLSKNGKADWKVVWGPAIQFSGDLFKDEENVMFVAQQISDTANYKVVIRGTNFHSLPSWIKDIDVAPFTHKWLDPNGLKKGVIAAGTHDNLKDLLHIMPLKSKDSIWELPGAGFKIDQFLAIIALKQKINITFTGHSLGGGMAPVVALYFAENGVSSWDPNSNASINITTFAGPTPGDVEFANYLTSIIPNSKYNRYFNANDVVPRGFNLKAYKSIKSIYKGTGVKKMTRLELIGYKLLLGPLEELKLIRNIVYEHTGNPMEFSFNVDTTAAGGNSFYDQLDYQHISSYPTYLNVAEVLTILNSHRK